MLNSTAIQGFELDDWHLLAPLHSNSLILPALFAAASQENAKNSVKFDGKTFLLSVIAGYETGPRVGNALYGKDMLTRGWHSGAVFGPSASAAAVSKLLNLSAESIEDALGIACTQAGGLMSAQFGSDAKRMQHGFASRNGLFAAFLAKQGYTGIKNVYEESYGGFLAMFGEGSRKEPRYLPQEISKNLGQNWQLKLIGVKLHASMAANHCTIDCIQKLQELYPKELADLGGIASIKLEMGEVAWKHGGFEVKRPVSTTGAQMSCAYAAAVQLVDGQVLADQFGHKKLERDIIWELVGKTQCVHERNVEDTYRQRVTITLKTGTALTQELEGPKSVFPGISNEDIVDKWRRLTQGIIEEKRRDAIEKLVLEIEGLEDVGVLEELLAGPIMNPIA